MFYLIHGTDKKSEEKFISLIENLLAKKDKTALFRVDDETFDPDWFEELVLGQTLFDKKYIVACRRVFANQLACEFIETKAEAIAGSPNIFIFHDKTIPPKTLKKISKYADKTQEFAAFETKIKPAFNIFSLGDALGSRDRKKLWLIFTQALQAGVPAEEIFWQFSRTVKNMLLVKKADRPTDLGLHPFVLSKAQKFAGNFETGKLAELSQKLVEIFHAVRNGEREMDIALERFVFES